MLMLAVQSLLLILAAFIAGAMIACFMRRVFFMRDNEHPTTDPDGGRGSKAKQHETITTTKIEKTTETRTVSATEASRFGRALTGTSSANQITSVAARSADDNGGSTETGSVAEGDAVAPRPAGDVLSTVEEDGDPSTTLASSPSAVDFTTQRISNAAVTANNDEESALEAGSSVIAGAISGARGAATPPAVAEDEIEDKQAPSVDQAPENNDEASPMIAPSADVAMLRSVRSKALVSPDVPAGVEENIFRLPAASGTDVDDLKRIRGIGVLIEKKLNAMGVRTYEQIANWTAGDVSRVSDSLDFKGRIERESWIEQARILTSGGFTEFSKRG